MHEEKLQVSIRCRILPSHHLASMAMGEVALVTGGNAGIGLTLCERLLTTHENLRLCLACRSKMRGEAAVSALRLSHPHSDIRLVLLDTSSLESVYRAANQIKAKYERLDYVYLNAGIMPVSTVNWTNFWHDLFSSKCIHMFATGEGLLRQVDGNTADSLRQIFATNLFGHFTLIKQLEELMGGSRCPSTQIIWTSSSNAKKGSFNVDDLQHEHGSEPYSSSKYAADLVSVAINENLNVKAIYSHTTCPGLVMTNLTYGILPSWFWYLILPLLWLLRIFTGSMTQSPYNGSEALVWLSLQKPECLDPFVKYHSRVSVLGNPYVESVKMDITKETAQETYKKLSDLEREYSSKYCRRH